MVWFIVSDGEAMIDLSKDRSEKPRGALRSLQRDPGARVQRNFSIQYFLSR
jgi:hypothetical protein